MSFLDEKGLERLVEGMASSNNKRISELPLTTTLGDNDLFEVAQGGENRSISGATIKSGGAVIPNWANTSQAQEGTSTTVMMNPARTRDVVLSGWIQLSGSFAFSSWTATVRTGVISSPNLTGILNVGMKLRFWQDGIWKYGFITAITASQITLYMGTNFTLTNTFMSSVSFSTSKAPHGFPLNASIWDIRIVHTAVFTVNTPAVGTWFNVTPVVINMPIGVWEASYSISVGGTVPSAANYQMSTTLSTTNNSQSDSHMTCFSSIEGTVATTPTTFIGTFYRERILTPTTATNLFLLIRAGQTGASNINAYGNISPTVVELKCMYL